MTQKKKDKAKKKDDTPEVLEKPILEENETQDPKPEESAKKKDDTPDHPSIPLGVFCSLSGVKPDQLAGFRMYATTQKLKPMTVPQWRAKLVEFQNKPTR